MLPHCHLAMHALCHLLPHHCTRRHGQIWLLPNNSAAILLIPTAVSRPVPPTHAVSLLQVLAAGGHRLLLSLPAACLVPGVSRFEAGIGAVLRNLLEDPATLESWMEAEIRSSMTIKGPMRDPYTGRAFPSNSYANPTSRCVRHSTAACWRPMFALIGAACTFAVVSRKGCSRLTCCGCCCTCKHCVCACLGLSFCCHY